MNCFLHAIRFRNVCKVRLTLSLFGSLYPRYVASIDSEFILPELPPLTNWQLLWIDK